MYVPILIQAVLVGSKIHYYLFYFYHIAKSLEYLQISGFKLIIVRIKINLNNKHHTRFKRYAFKTVFI